MDRNGRELMRVLISKVEIAAGFGVLVLCAAHTGWCWWSIPRHGVRTPHGIETGLCNWGTDLATVALVIIATITLVSGVIGLRVRTRTLAWYVTQVPVTIAWGWVAYGISHALLSN